MWHHVGYTLESHCKRRGPRPSDQKVREPQKGNEAIIQEITRPEGLFWHLFGEDSGWVVTFTGQQSRLTHPDAPANQLTETRQRYWRYPQKAEEAADYLRAGHNSSSSPEEGF